jgi:hypothetical protein
VHCRLIGMKFNYAHPAVQIICADDVYFFVLIRTGVSEERAVKYKKRYRRLEVKEFRVKEALWR